MPPPCSSSSGGETPAQRLWSGCSRAGGTRESQIRFLPAASRGLFGCSCGEGAEARVSQSQNISAELSPIISSCHSPLLIPTSASSKGTDTPGRKPRGFGCTHPEAAKESLNDLTMLFPYFQTGLLRILPPLLLCDSSCCSCLRRDEHCPLPVAGESPTTGPQSVCVALSFGVINNYKGVLKFCTPAAVDPALSQTFSVLDFQVFYQGG